MEEAIKTGKWISAKVFKWFEERLWLSKSERRWRVRSLDLCEGNDPTNYRSSGVHQGDQRFGERKKGKYEAVEVKREYDYMEDAAQQSLEEATAAAVKAAEVSKRRAMEAQRAVEAQQAAASWASVSMPPGLSEPIKPTHDKQVCVLEACVGDSRSGHGVRQGGAE